MTSGESRPTARVSSRGRSGGPPAALAEHPGPGGWRGFTGSV